jgi:N-acetylneuraminate synthase
MQASPVDKDAVATDMAPLRAIFTKSVVARQPLPAGTVLAEAHLAVKKPGTGLPAERLPDLVGRTLRRDIVADEMILDDDLQP